MRSRVFNNQSFKSAAENNRSAFFFADKEKSETNPLYIVCFVLYNSYV